MGQMQGRCWEKLVFAELQEAFYKLFDASTCVDPDPEASYEKTYGPFEQQIADECVALGVPQDAIDLFDDWCPNLTRHVTVTTAHVTSELRGKLSMLLLWPVSWVPNRGSDRR
jgi:hypothetical protein